MRFETKTKSLLYSMEFTHGLRRALMSGLGLVYFLSFGFSLTSITTLFSISVIIMTFFEFPTGAIADYDSRKKTIMISFFLMAIAFFGLFVFKSFWLLGASWILGDIAWTFYSGAGSAWSIDALNLGKQKSKIISLISKGYIFENGGNIIGGLIGLVVIAINFSFVWLFVSVSQIFMLLIVWKYMEERNFKPEKVQQGYVMKALIKAKESFNYIIHKKNKQLRVLLLGSIIGNFTFSAFFVCMPLLFTKLLGVTPDKLSGIASLVTAIAILSPFMAEKVTHKFGIRKSMISFVALVSVFVVIFALSKSLILAIASFAVIKVGLAAVSVVEDSAYQHQFDSKLRASLGSTNNIVWALAFAVSVFLTGYAVNFFGIVPTLIVSGCLVMIEAVVYIWGLK
jgi:MFS family permease